jgi:general secretion pathway protein C
VSAAAWYEELKSGPGWSRLLGQRATQLVVTVLLIALAIDCALILTHALGQSALPAAASGPMGSARPTSAVNPTVELATVVNAHLFGVAGAQAGGNAPQTTMPLILAGVLAGKDPAKGQAIIGESASSAKLIGVGASIPGGARLNSVYGDRVLIERNGRLETLMLPRTPLRGGATGPPPLAMQPAALRDNSTVLAGLVRVQPVFNQGKLSGYRIFPGGTRGTSAFNQLGLHAGDLIVGINGTPLDDAARAMDVLQTLSSSASATVTVSRNGQSQDVNLNLATLNTETEASPSENASGASGAAGTPGSEPQARPNGPVQMRGRGFPPADPGAAAPTPGVVPAPAPAPAPADASPAAGAAANSER